MRSLSLKVLTDLKVLKRPQKLTVISVCSFCLLLNSFKRKEERVDEDSLKEWSGAMQFINENSCRILSDILQVAARCEDGNYDFELIQKIRQTCFGDLKEESLNPRMAVSRESKVIMQFVLAILQYVYALEAEKSGEAKPKSKRQSVNKARSPHANLHATTPAPEEEVRIKPLNCTASSHAAPATDRSPTPCSLKHRSSAVTIKSSRASFADLPKQIPQSSASAANLHAPPKKVKLSAPAPSKHSVTPTKERAHTQRSSKLCLRKHSPPKKSKPTNMKHSHRPTAHGGDSPTTKLIRFKMDKDSSRRCPAIGSKPTMVFRLWTQPILFGYLRQKKDVMTNCFRILVSVML